MIKQRGYEIMKRNGFTMVELLAVITILGILSAVAVGGLTQYLDKAKKQDFEMLEKNLKTAADNYFLSHANELPAIGGETTLTAAKLTQEDYLSGLKDPDRTGSQCDLTRSKVTIKRSGNSNDFNMSLDYKVCIICSKRKSKNC